MYIYVLEGTFQSNISEVTDELLVYYMLNTEPLVYYMLNTEL